MLKRLQTFCGFISFTYNYCSLVEWVYLHLIFIVSDVSEKKYDRLTVITPLKMVAKVLPTVRKEEEKPDIEEIFFSQKKGKMAKKQVFPWLVKFNALCREAAGSRSYAKLDELMDIFIR